jgi:hypothetical protein
LSKFQQLKCALNCGPGDILVQQHGDEEPAVEKVVAASVEWIMVRMNLLAYYKKLFLSYYDATSV